MLESFKTALFEAIKGKIASLFSPRSSLLVKQTICKPVKNEKQRKQRFFNSACHILIIENEVDKVSYEIGATKQTWLVSIIALKVTKDEVAMFRAKVSFLCECFSLFSIHYQ